MKRRVHPIWMMRLRKGYVLVVISAPCVLMRAVNWARKSRNVRRSCDLTYEEGIPFLGC